MVKSRVFVYFAILPSLLAARSARSQVDLQTSASTAPTKVASVDVVVCDAKGRFLHGLTPADFNVSENRVPLTVVKAEEQPVGGSTPTVILLDQLNSPLTDAAIMHAQFEKIIDSLSAQGPIAVFGLNDSLVLLKDFGSSTAELKASLAQQPEMPSLDALQQLRMLPSAGYELLVSQVRENSDQAAAPPTRALFDRPTTVSNVEQKAEFTATALSRIANYLAPMPGRKNLIWLAGGFQSTLAPLDREFASQTNYREGLSRSSVLPSAEVNLAQNRIAVYPIDTGGATLWMGRTYEPLDHIAQQSGGKAFYGSDDIPDLVTKALKHGASYYIVTFAVSAGRRSIDRNISISVPGKHTRISYRAPYVAPAALP